ncbi:MAG: peptide deformylase [Firmicutes bacterium]|nr:peptide deformylase [Bacillota bacterium]
MAVLEIIENGAAVLREKAQPVPQITKRIRRLVKDMLETMEAAEGVGLAAPQVGVSQRIIVLDVGDGPIVLINPKISEASGSDIDVEGCLSVPNVWGYVERAAQVVVTGLDEDGKSVRIQGEELLARALQHEIDHLDGVLFIDKMLEILPEDGSCENGEPNEFDNEVGPQNADNNG